MSIIEALQHSKPGSPCSAGGDSESTAPGSTRSLSPPIGCGGGVLANPNTILAGAADSYHCSESNRRRRYSSVASGVPEDNDPYIYDHLQYSGSNEAIYQELPPSNTPLRAPRAAFHQYVQQQAPDERSAQEQPIYYQPNEDYHHHQPYSTTSIDPCSSNPVQQNNSQSDGVSAYSQIYSNNPTSSYSSSAANTLELALYSQKAVAFLPGPRERICVLGSPIEFCPRCRHEGFGSSPWRPHRHVGELKIRYICERYFGDLDSNHHFDLPLCPVCNSVLYLYEFNAILGLSTTRRLHKYVLKCNGRHVLPLLDLFCQTKKSGEKCNANFKLQWSYGTMVKRCEAQRNRDHDLWWVRYKNEWKQRRTIIRYKKDFLSHLSEPQRALVLGLGLEGEPPPDPKAALGPTFDALRSNAGNSSPPPVPKTKKRNLDKLTTTYPSSSGTFDDPEYDCAFGKRDVYGHASTTGLQQSGPQQQEATGVHHHHLRSSGDHHLGSENHSCGEHHLVEHRGEQQRLHPGFARNGSRPATYGSSADEESAKSNYRVKEDLTYMEDEGFVEKNNLFYGFPLQFEANHIITGTPMNELQEMTPNGRSPVAATVCGHIMRSNPGAENTTADT